MSENSMRISLAGLKISPTCFFMSFASGFYVSTVFLPFLHKKEMRRGAETAV
jgi:hypothetical protein